jgi:hypothetical protein
MEYIPYLRNSLLHILKTAGTEPYTTDEDGNAVSGVTTVIDILDEYGLSRDDLMETMKDLQLIIANDKVMRDCDDNILHIHSDHFISLPVLNHTCEYIYNSEY